MADDDVPSVEDLKVKRNGDGEVEPVLAESPQTGRSYWIRPVTYGDSLGYEDPFESPVNYSPEEKAKLIREHIVEPDLGDVTAEDLQAEFDAQTVNDLVLCVGLYSGLLREEGEKAAKKADRSASP